MMVNSLNFSISFSDLNYRVMSTTGSLSDFSLPEILQFIEQGRKTGLLTVRTLSESPASKSRVHYIWVDQGCIVAAANRLDEKGLVTLIEQRQWVSERVIYKLAQLCPTDKSLGKYLFDQGVLRAAQLKQLFLAQVRQQVCALFNLQDGEFQFEQNVSVPRLEVTGLSVSAGIPILLATSQDLLTLRSDGYESGVAAKVLPRHSSYSGKTPETHSLKTFLRRLSLA
jgi:hypothetical protein